MATEASQPLKISLPVSAALAQALYNEWNASTIANGYAGTPAQYTFVGINVNGQAELLNGGTSTVGTSPIGVIQNAPFILSQAGSQVGGGMAEIVVLGVSKVRVSSAGALSAFGANGYSTFITCSLSSTSPGCALPLASNAVGTTAAGTKPVVGTYLPQPNIVGANALDLVRAIVNCTAVGYGI